MMKTPSFWYANTSSLLPLLLSPIAKIWATETKRRLSKAGYQSRIPVICIGNITVGGSGKTPMAIKLAQFYQKHGYQTAFLSRGYGAHIKQAICVDPQTHSYLDVGDEPLLLSTHGEAWVSPCRAEGAKAIEKDGHADIIIMDDGMQNASLSKDYNILVIDGGFGLGNQHVIPAGPLREPLKENLKRADIAVINGEDQFNTGSLLSIPILSAELIADDTSLDKNQTYWAFCGLGRPSKFYTTLAQIGLNVQKTTDFSDHHPYSEKEIIHLKHTAKNAGAQLITTEKDKIRIPSHLQKGISYLPIDININLESIKSQLPLF